MKAGHESGNSSNVRPARRVALSFAPPHVGVWYTKRSPMAESTESPVSAPSPAAPSPGAGGGVRFEPKADAVLQLPNRCANCGEAAGASARLAPPFGVAGRALLIPYCSRCARTVEQSKTRSAIAVAASFLVGLVLLLGLPLMPGRFSMLTYGMVVTLGAALPLLEAWFASRRKRHEAGQTSAEAGVWWDKRGLLGSNAAWMSELAELNQGVAQTLPRWQRPVNWQVALLPATFAAVSPSVFQWLFPTLVVLNLSPTDFDLVVDGVTRGTVGVTSLESSSAGLRLPLGAGKHVLEARPRGDGVDTPPATYRVEVALDAGDEYLFAPGSDGHCFWLERTVYGAADGKSRVQALGGKDGFFRLPSPVDTWFGANPQPNADRVSTGGEMVAIRQGRCADKPDAPRL